jgi:hypothetical protein
LMVSRCQWLPASSRRPGGRGRHPGHGPVPQRPVQRLGSSPWWPHSAPPALSPPATSSDRSASHGSPQTAISTPRTSPSWPLLHANRASPPPTTSPPRCPTAITPQRCHCSAAMTFSPADHCSPSQPVSVSPGLRRAAPERVGTFRQPVSPSPMSSRRARCHSPHRVTTGWVRDPRNRQTNTL